MNAPAIACTLDSANFQDRMAWIAELNARSLRSARRVGLTLTLDYAPEAIDDVRKMVAQERQCRVFLVFQIDERPEGVRVSVDAPKEARDAADALFEPFASRSLPDVVKRCGCVGECGA